MAMPTVKFVRHGTLAPATLPDNEVWVDVGGRNDGNVLDHHNDKGHGSTAALALSRVLDENWGASHSESIRYVTHMAPDLDGICGLWILMRAADLEWRSQLLAIEQIVDAVTRHDQGLEEDVPVNESWPIIFNLIQEHEDGDDTTRIEIGLRLLDTSLNAIVGEGSLSKAAAAIRTPEIEDFLEMQKGLFEKDLQIATKLQLALPQRDAGALNHSSRHIVVDALCIEAPKCKMLKHFARRSNQATLGHGYSLMVVSYPLILTDPQMRYWRHIISLDARVPGSLEGLGQVLENEEQTFENNHKIILPQGRERVAVGKGRFGGNVPSPWYDGRGHNFTIVDSPAIGLNGMSVIGSCLPPRIVMEAVVQFFAHGAKSS